MEPDGCEEREEVAALFDIVRILPVDCLTLV
jgi:hypothetical protein